MPVFLHRARFHASQSRAYGPSAAASSACAPDSTIRPASITTIRSARAAWLRRWAITTPVRSARADAAAFSRRSASLVPASAVASSSRATSGSTRASRSRARCWARAAARSWPPAPTRVPRPSGSASSHAVAPRRPAAARISASVASGAKRRRSSATVPSKTWTSWLTRTIRRRRTSAGSSASGTPSSRTRPESGVRTPARILASVVLPAPLAPTTATVSPGSTVRETASSARRPAA